MSQGHPRALQEVREIFILSFLKSRKSDSKALQVDMLSKILPLVVVADGSSSQLMHLLRDAFFLWNNLAENEEDKVTRHKLLHLIELCSGDWQLSSSALLYYYPAAPVGNEIKAI